MATATPNEKIIAQVGEELVELTGADLDKFNADRATWQAEIDAAKLAEEQKAEQKAALLARLGLTEEELKTILG